eukprot:TRINITY_DN9994_c0_g3_i1.p1 TRINITY_DN9994_c0_g3~~TRINITY_DN9994_c0_g3_i1.p1  ORF type:complete len:1358 (+),score=440.58 TRINITY_DN9994_c0_g3_i1:63-4136(+)
MDFELSATLTFWGQDCSAGFDSATNVVVSRSGSRVCVLDAAAGCISFWAVDASASSAALRPLSFALTPSDAKARVMQVAAAVHREREALACVCEDGSLLVLNLHDGSHLATAPRLLHQAISACMLPPVYGSSLLAVGGAHCQLTIVDCDCLSVVCTAEVPPPGFTGAMAAQRLPQRRGTPPACSLVAVMADRVLRYWVVQGGDAIAVQPRRTTPLPLRGVPMAVDLHPSLPLVLVVVSDGWAVFVSHAAQPLVIVPPPGGDEVLAGGTFMPQGCSGVRVGVFTSSGRAVAYILPDTVTHAAEKRAAQLRVDADQDGAEEDLHVADVVATELQSYRTGAAETVWGASEWGSESKQGQYLCAVAPGGKLFVATASAEGQPLSETASASAAGSSAAAAADKDECTCSVLDVSPLTSAAPMIVRGHRDGTVRVVEIGRQQERTKWHAHDTAVLHLLAVSADGGDGHRRLVTASQCGAVSLWLWGVFRHLASFHLHTRPVARLFEPPEWVVKRHGALVGSCGGDGSVVLYDVERCEVFACFRGHGSGDAAPSALFFLEHVDCAVVAVPGSRQVHVWHIASGKLTRVLRGSLGAAFLARVREASTNYAVLPPPQSADEYSPTGSPLPSPTSGGGGGGGGGGGSFFMSRPPPAPAPPAAPSPARQAGDAPFIRTFSTLTGGRRSSPQRETSGPATPTQVPSLSVSIPALIRHLHSLAPKDKDKDKDKEKEEKREDKKEKQPEAAAAAAAPVALPSSVVAVLGYMLQDDSHPTVAALRDALHLAVRPHPTAAVCFSTPIPSSRMGFAGPVLLPAAESGSWRRSATATARRLTSLLSVLYALISADPVRLKPICKAAINYYAAILPQALLRTPLAHEADFFWCLSTLREPIKDVQFAVRCVLNAVLRYKKPPQLQALTERLFRTARSPSASLDEVHVAMLGVAITTVQCPALVQQGSQTALSACQGLLSIITASPTAVNSTLMTTALTLLGDSYEVWAQLVPSPIELIKLLFTISTTHEEGGGQGVSMELPKAANSTLLTVGAAHLSTFFTFADHVLGDTSMASPVATTGRHDGAAGSAQGGSSPFRSHICMLLTLNQMIRRHAVAFQPHLLRVASMLLKVLDPHFPSLRDSCMHASTVALRTAVKTFPMVSFHQGRQQLAVGDSTQGQVVVWDMKTASKWLVWEAHQSGTACVSFSTIGDQLGTFGPKEGQLKIWTTEMSMFQVLSSSHRPRSVVQFDLRQGQTRLEYQFDQAARDVLAHVRIVWVSPHAVELCPGVAPPVALSIDREAGKQPLQWTVRDCVVVEVPPSSAPARAGAAPGMRIVRVAGRTVDSDRAVEATVGDWPEPRIEVQVLRRARCRQYELR